MQAKHARCPKCQGQLYLEQDVGSQFRLPPEWTCLQCGWRRTYTPRELERTFAVTDEGTTPDDIATVVSAAVFSGIRWLGSATDVHDASPVREAPQLAEHPGNITSAGRRQPQLRRSPALE